MAKSSVEEFLKRKNASITVRTYLIDVLGAMAFGLFAFLLIGTILGTLSRQLQVEVFNVIADYAKSVTSAALGTAIAHALETSQLVLFSTAAVDVAGNALGGPVGALVTAIVVVGLGKIVFKETCLDIIVTPGITIISGMLVAQFMEPDAAQFMNWFENLVKTATEMQSFIMRILVSVLIGITLILPINGAAVCIALSLNGLVGGAATAGCCAQMVGFVVTSYRENKADGLIAQGLGTSMLQMGNIVLNPRIWIPPALASMITGPIATMVFRLGDTPAGADTGTCGLMGPVSICTAMGDGTRMWVGILLVYFLFPSVLTFVFGEMLYRVGWIKDGDLKLDL